jgi:hypothetical protein
MDHLIFESDLTDYGSDLMKTDQIVDCKIPSGSHLYGELNDCLYKCLKLIYRTFSKMPKTIEKPKYIKEKLGLSRDAPVPVISIDKVEDLARNLALNITGDVIWISKSKADRRTTLVLSEGHYSVATNPDRQHPSHIDHKQKAPFVYREGRINNTVTIYNSKKTKILTSTQF